MTDEPGWAGETRHLDAGVLGELVGGLEGKTFLVAGPPQMAEAVAASLTDAGLPDDRPRRRVQRLLRRGPDRPSERP